jgi:putrescine transport system substrate-binding protein
MKCPSALSLVAATMFTAGLNSAWANPQTVNLFNWYELIAPEIPMGFQKEFGNPVVMDPFDSAEMMQSKVMAGRTGYDVVVATSNVLPNLINSGVLQPIDRKEIGNWNQIDPDILEKLSVNDPGNRYAVPYLWGTTGIGYDTDKVEAALGKNAPVNSWDLIFKVENISKLKDCGVAMLDSPSEIISIALHYLGLPSNSQNPDDYKKAEALLSKVRPYVRYFDSSKIDSDLADGSICIAVGWANGALAAKALNEKSHTGRNVAYSIPKEGALVWSENMVLLKDAPHPKEGMKFISYMIRPDIISKTTNYTLYPNANVQANALVDKNLRENTWIYLDKETKARLFPLESLPANIERIRTRAWSKVKNGV